MKVPRFNKRDVTICSVIIILVVVGETWWHHIPLLQRVSPSGYYYLLLSSASEKCDKGDLQGAKRILLTAIEKSPDTPYAYEALADIMVKAGDTNAALLNYESAIRHLGKGFTDLLSATQQTASRPFIEEKIRRLRN